MGFSSPGEIALISTERLEALLVEHGGKDASMPLQPRLCLARMREEVVSIPGSVPEHVIELKKLLLPNKRWEDWTTEDLDTYRRKLTALGLNRYFANSTATTLGLEYVQLAGRPLLEAADRVLATSAWRALLLPQAQLTKPRSRS